MDVTRDADEQVLEDLEDSSPRVEEAALQQNGTIVVNHDALPANDSLSRILTGAPSPHNQPVAQ